MALALLPHPREEGALSGRGSSSAESQPWDLASPVSGGRLQIQLSRPVSPRSFPQRIFNRGEMFSQEYVLRSAVLGLENNGDDDDDNS